MSYPTGLEISRGIAKGLEAIHVFGRNRDVGDTFAPVCIDGIYRTPTADNATQLRIKAGGNSNDTALGSGAQSIKLIGLDPQGYKISETIATAGTSASDPTQQSFIRLLSAEVASSGVYASQTTPSHQGEIVIENAAGNEDWATIAADNIGRGRTQIGVYTVPKDRSITIPHLRASCDRDRRITLVLFTRKSVLETSAPFAPMLLLEEFTQIGGVHDFVFEPPLGKFEELTDVGFMAHTQSTAVDVAISFEVEEARP